jgi:hypothetical protein
MDLLGEVQRFIKLLARLLDIVLIWEIELDGLR